MSKSTNELCKLHTLVMAERNEEERKHEAEMSGSLVSMSRAILSRRTRIERVYDHPILHVMAHRGEEESHSYVENFVQYRDPSKPLLVDLGNMSNILRVILKEAKNLPAMDVGGKSDPC